MVDRLVKVFSDGRDHVGEPSEYSTQGLAMEKQFQVEEVSKPILAADPDGCEICQHCVFVRVFKGSQGLVSCQTRALADPVVWSQSDHSL